MELMVIASRREISGQNSKPASQMAQTTESTKTSPEEQGAHRLAPRDEQARDDEPDAGEQEVPALPPSETSLLPPIAKKTARRA